MDIFILDRVIFYIHILAALTYAGGHSLIILDWIGSKAKTPSEVYSAFRYMPAFALPWLPFSAITLLITGIGLALIRGWGLGHIWILVLIAIIVFEVTEGIVIDLPNIRKVIYLSAEAGASSEISSELAREINSPFFKFLRWLDIAWGPIIVYLVIFKPL